MNKQISEVWRGREILSMDSRLLDLGGIINSSHQVDREKVTNLLHNLQLHSKYSDSDCINSFYADKEINLIGCGFFGALPNKSIGPSQVQYEVTLRLDMVWKSFSNSEQRTRTLAKVSQTPQINMNGYDAYNVFYVDFDKPVKIDPTAIKYDLVFRLKGPPSYELDPSKFNSTVEVNGVKFKFWPGSKQLPVLRFTVDQQTF